MTVLASGFHQPADAVDAKAVRPALEAALPDLVGPEILDAGVFQPWYPRFSDMTNVELRASLQDKITRSSPRHDGRRGGEGEESLSVM